LDRKTPEILFRFDWFPDFVLLALWLGQWPQSYPPRWSAGEASTAREGSILGAWDLLHNLGENLIRVDIFRFRLEIEDDAMA
jgi:hypothetical protein